jgi:hypothetical protein
MAVQDAVYAATQTPLRRLERDRLDGDAVIAAEGLAQLTADALLAIAREGE